MSTVGHIFRKIRLTPSPSTSGEVRHLYESFRRIGNIESFYLPKDPRGLAKFHNEVHILWNISNTSSLDPFTPYQPPKDAAYIESLKTRLSAHLHRIVAVPRYQLVHKNLDYLEGKSSIEFRYQTTSKDKFTVSQSHVRQPFCLLDVEDKNVAKRIKKSLRFNFEKFTKIDVL
ncbi:hypothetical protein PSN45_000929 [Yamadazyma tenuis]|uniref:uncharacterized protein n=1 Tax=Candida tenuis TaxID=2315449 RepID=UPI00279800F4|nr:hypothetical protein PSN45_000929 [Yamadazyma tenuis]